MTQENCLTELCQNHASTRGICATCYAVARTLVEKKKTTWEELEAQGLCKSTKIRKGGLFTQAFKKKLNK